jgi:hypothetical protein
LRALLARRELVRKRLLSVEMVDALDLRHEIVDVGSPALLARHLRRVDPATSFRNRGSSRIAANAGRS